MITISSFGGAATPLHDLGLCLRPVRWRTWGADEAVIEAVDGYTGTLPYSDGDQVTLRVDGAILMHGRVDGVTRSADAPGRSRAITVQGWAWYLENVIYQQAFKGVINPAADSDAVPTLADFWRSSVWLYTKQDGAAATTAETALDILQMAAAAAALEGAALTASVTLSGLTLKPAEARDTTCMAALRTVCKWHPRAALRTVYTESGATLRLSDPSGVWTVNAAGGLVSSLSVRRLDRMRPSAVVVKARRQNNVNEQTYYEDWQESAPGTVTDTRSPGVLCQTLDLEGGSLTTQEQDVVTAPVPPVLSAAQEESLSAPQNVERQTALRRFWRRHVPWLRHPGIAPLLDAGAILFTRFAAAVDAPDEDEDEDAEGIVTPSALFGGRNDSPYSLDLADYPSELTEGSMPAWSKRLRSAPVSAAARVRVNPDYTPASGADLSVLKKAFGDALTHEHEVTTGYTGTNAVTHRYRSVAGYKAPEGWPEGIAAALWAELDRDFYEGSLRLAGVSTPPVVTGHRISITGARAEWVSTDAVISDAAWDPGTGMLAVTFGAPTVLTASDLLELSRASRTTTSSSRDPAERREGRSLSSAGRTVAGVRRGPKITPATLPEPPPQGECCPWHAEILARGNTIELRFAAGLYNGRIPNNLGETFRFPALSTRYFYLNVNRGAGLAISSVTIASGSSPPAAIGVTSPAPPLDYMIPLAVWAEGRVHQVQCGNITSTAIEVGRTAQEPAFFGAEPFVRHWTWRLS